jgi:hypothetical protein
MAFSSDNPEEMSFNEMCKNIIASADDNGDGVV